MGVGLSLFNDDLLILICLVVQTAGFIYECPVFFVNIFMFLGGVWILGLVVLIEFVLALSYDNVKLHDTQIFSSNN